MASIANLLPMARQSAPQLNKAPKPVESTARSGAPPYNKRSGWKPQTDADFGDGGAFPEIHIAQYPLGMGRNTKSSAASDTAKTLTLQVKSDGKLNYDAIAKQGHDANRNIQTSFSDLIPLRQRVRKGEISLSRPSQEEVQSTTERTRLALAKIVSQKEEDCKPTCISSSSISTNNKPTYVRYTPANHMTGAHNTQRIIKIIDKVQDPLEPPKFKHRKVPAGPPSPPVPILRSPPRKITSQDQQDWHIPAAISNWKNPKGFTIALDKRVAADGRRLQEVAINDNHAKLAEALYVSERNAREEVRLRASMQQKVAEKERAEKEEQLRKLAQEARRERDRSARDVTASPPRRDHGSDVSDTESSGESGESDHFQSEDDEESKDAVRKRRELQIERRKEAEKELRLSRMGRERKFKVLAREQNRDISERVALGAAKPSKPSGDAQFDSRLFSQVSLPRTFNEDEVYEKSLFSAQEAVQSIYRPRGKTGADPSSFEDGDDALTEISRERRFDALSATASTKHFQDTDSNVARDGPVQFVKDEVDPFGVSRMVAESRETQSGLDRDPKKRRV